MLKSQKIEYHDGDALLEGYYAVDDSTSNTRPAVMVVHDWSGKNALACKKADQLAELGYAAFAIDMYGKNKIGTTNQEKTALMQPLMDDRAKLQKRVTAGFNTMKTLDLVDTHNISAIGFCFGGLCVLDLARTGADVKGVVSFHGILSAPENLTEQSIKSKVLVLQGFDDPMALPNQVVTFGEEMTRAHVNWQVDLYGNTMHAFTNPQANDPALGTVYNKQADERSWIAMKEFFKEIFSS